MNDLFDITQNRHKGNAESKAAFGDVKDSLPRQRAEVLAAISASPQGITCKDLAAKWNVGMNVISGRFSELKRAGLIKKTGVHKGSAIMQRC